MDKLTKVNPWRNSEEPGKPTHVRVGLLGLSIQWLVHLPPAGNSLECKPGSAPIWVRHRAATATFQEEADNPV